MNNFPLARSLARGTRKIQGLNVALLSRSLLLSRLMNVFLCSAPLPAEYRLTISKISNENRPATISAAQRRSIRHQQQQQQQQLLLPATSCL
ncbi:hypothetical protein HN011_007825 [Eciton burchellii]|nr:hypothetical protein HN011_007825 [Eciton burchellii]